MCKRTKHVTSNNVESCWSTMLRPFARSLRRTLITQGLQRLISCILPTMGVVASVSTPLSKCTQQLPTLLAQQCWGLFLPLARSLKQLTLHVHRTFFVHFFAVTLHDTKGAFQKSELAGRTRAGPDILAMN